MIAEGAFSIQSVLDPERARSLLQVWWWHITGRVRRDRGFVVPVLDALAVLERARPLEAGWWRQNAPHLCEPGKTFVFDLACGELVD